MFSADELAGTLRQLTPSPALGYAVALSGGADSLALLCAAQPAAAALGRPLRALHVDHGLQSAAAEFTAACKHACTTLGVQLTVLRVEAAAPAGRSVEEWAREARYAALAGALQPGECLLSAHHQDDQAETFLLQALRGAGVAGLSCMPACRPLGPGWHLRPLLQVSRRALRDHLAGTALTLVDDAMNAERRYDRSYIRHEVWPALLRRWPAASAVLSRSAAHVAQAHAADAAQAREELARVRDGGAVAIPALRRLPRERQAAVLRAFLDAAGARHPSQARLEEALRQMLEAGEDAVPSIAWDVHALRRYRDRIHLTPAQPPAVAPREWRWREQNSCQLGDGLGCLRLVEQAGGLDPAHMPERLQVRARAGGERLRCERGGVTHSLRHLLQGRGVVPWARPQLPLLWASARLLAVADLWMASDYCVAAGAPGLGLRWEGGPCID